MKTKRIAKMTVIVFLAGSATLASGDVFNMPAELTSLETVPVGNAGNVG